MIRVPGPFVVVCLMVALLTIACGGGSSGSTTPSATSATTGPGLLVYLDITSHVVASDLITGEHWERYVDPTKEGLISAECSRDGSRIAYLNENFSEPTHRQIVIAGEN